MKRLVLTMAVLLTLSTIPLSADVVGFEMEDLNIGYSAGDRSIWFEVFLTNNTSPATVLSYGYGLLMTISGGTNLTFNSVTSTVNHTMTMSTWDPSSEYWDNGQTIKFANHDVITPFSVDNDDGLARFEVFVPGGTLGSYTVMFHSVNVSTGTYLNDDFWVMPGMIPLDTVAIGTITAVPEPGTIAIFAALATVGAFIARSRSPGETPKPPDDPATW